MKTILAALAGAAILAAPLPVLAQSHGGGSGSHGGGGGFHGGGFHGGPGPAAIGGYHPGGVRPAYGSGPHYGDGEGHYAGGYRGDHGYSHYRGGYPYYAGGLGLGFALGLNAGYGPWSYGSPWYDYYDAPFYGYSRTVTVENNTPPPPVYDAAPPAPAAQAAPACGSWSWDAARQAYNWVPC
ncbi:hypothetical protein DJ021_08420 [Phenylobacterium hankyongense]|uniref:Uncharacterized protein n=1 Tax=Phenylobacterium hankyongense TaxID=1813876 RepID=A0A328AZ09_9CAUL|nr:hypothetical protein [Phenylobacterium hankyongense]RAK59827.1 hypothetical protein DJ021_08420 [Phenylobacterium hankyongense]